MYLCNSRDCVGEPRRNGRRMRAGEYGMNFMSGVLSLLATTSSIVIIGRYRNMWESKEHFSGGSIEPQSASESQKYDWLSAYCSVRVPKDRFMISALPAFVYYAHHFLIPSLEMVDPHGVVTHTEFSRKIDHVLNEIIVPFINFVMVRGVEMGIVKTEFDPMITRFSRFAAGLKPSHEGTIVSVNFRFLFSIRTPFFTKTGNVI